MHSELSNLWLFAQLFLKVALLTGIGPGMAIIFLYVQVSGRAVSQQEGHATALSEGNKPARNCRRLARAA
jgi:hypothetical protein